VAVESVRVGDVGEPPTGLRRTSTFVPSVELAACGGGRMVTRLEGVLFSATGSAEDRRGDIGSWDGVCAACIGETGAGLWSLEGGVV
jgi:hypothetical protein